MSSSASSSSPSDPSNFLTNPPSTVVKVVNTARDDMNGSLGIAVSFQADRGRYLVHMVATQSTAALKPENLVKASTMESYRAQYQQMRNDPRLRRELQTYYDKAKQRLHPVKPEHAAGGVLVLWMVLVYLIGITKTLMLASLLLLMGMLVWPDLLRQGASPRTVLQNFPMRCREALEQTLPVLQGRISNRVACGLVLAMLLLFGRTLVMSSSSSRTAATAVSSRGSGTSSVSSPEQYYKLGFDDATNREPYGTSLKLEDHVDHRMRSDDPPGFPDEDDDIPDPMMMPPPPPPPQTSSSGGFGYGTAMSAFFLFRTFKELGSNADGGGWDAQRALANLRTLETWKMAFLAFSFYNIVRAFV